MIDRVADHYSQRGGGQRGGLANLIADRLLAAGKSLESLTTADLAGVDEFHIRGRQATLELAERMQLSETACVLELGSGLGGPARTLAEVFGCRVIGIDLTPAFCEAAETLSTWVGLGDRVIFQQSDATDLPFVDDRFDAAMTLHAAMNIVAKDRMYAEARRVLKPGGVFAVYDVLQGEGGDVLFPVPWAREPSISHLVTPDAMKALLMGAGFTIREERDSTEQSQAWFEEKAAEIAKYGPAAVTFHVILGDDFPEMARNQVRNLGERRIRTVSYICEA